MLEFFILQYTNDVLIKIVNNGTSDPKSKRCALYDMYVVVYVWYHWTRGIPKPANANCRVFIQISIKKAQLIPRPQCTCVCISLHTYVCILYNRKSSCAEVLSLKTQVLNSKKNILVINESRSRFAFSLQAICVLFSC